MSVVTKNSVGLVKPQIARFEEPLQLQSGGALPAYQLIYETYGRLNTQASNAVLVCHALSSDHHAAGTYDKNSKNNGWWDTMIGPGKPIDTDKFFVVCCNNLGGCSGSTGPASINPETNRPYGPDFPIVTVEDWVQTQARLGAQLGVEVWAAVIGGSLGGMQALEWSTRFPHKVKHAVAIASAAKLTAQNIGFNDVARQAIRTDPEFHNGDYYSHDTIPRSGLRVARMLGHITYLSEGLMGEKFGRNLRHKTKFDYEFKAEFEVESYLRYQGDQFIERFDANTYLLMTKVLDYFDPAAKHNDQLAPALASAKADFMVISFSSDWRFSVERSREIVRALQSNKLNVSYAEIESPYGHDSFLLEIPQYFSIMHAYMQRIYNDIGEHE